MTARAASRSLCKGQKDGDGDGGLVCAGGRRTPPWSQQRLCTQPASGPRASTPRRPLTGLLPGLEHVSAPARGSSTSDAPGHASRSLSRHCCHSLSREGSGKGPFFKAGGQWLAGEAGAKFLGMLVGSSLTGGTPPAPPPGDTPSLSCPGDGNPHCTPASGEGMAPPKPDSRWVCCPERREASAAGAGA